MTISYLIRDDALVANIETSEGDITALPLITSGVMSLMNETHVQNLMSSLGLTAAQAMEALGIVDHRGATRKSIVIGPDVSGGYPWPVYKLINISDDFALYEVDADDDGLLSLHATMWAMSPVESLGLLAVVETFGISFYDSLVRTATGMIVQEALDRRDRIADYLESLGYSNVAALRAATTEGAQMLGIVTALEHTEAQMWEAMVNV